jgi:hypothetical protein
MHFAKPVVAVALLVASLAVASAQNREELETGIHGNTRASTESTRVEERSSQRDWRAAHAREHAVPGHIHIDAGSIDSPLLDDIHGGPAR